jgi:hypothetical protein
MVYYILLLLATCFGSINSSYLQVDELFTKEGDIYNRQYCCRLYILYRGADKSLARPERKQATATEDFDVHNWRNISKKVKVSRNRPRWPKGFRVS